ncbi:unnamed protein product [Meloidogyne enterolobii]|uniref:Uncharacterized protein n=1 Tax=Meloidogyne enterolobii TaxID=390850 RepID=A0ACB0ZG95_MELEN
MKKKIREEKGHFQRPFFAFRPAKSTLCVCRRSTPTIPSLLFLVLPAPKYIFLFISK